MNKTNKNPSPRTRFKKGQVVPGAGRPAIADKELRKFTAQEIANTILKFQALTQPEVLEISKSNKVPMLERIVARGLIHDCRTGTMSNFEKLLTRSIGAPAIRQELLGPGDLPLPKVTINIIHAAPPRQEGILDITPEGGATNGMSPDEIKTP